MERKYQRRLDLGGRLYICRAGVLSGNALPGAQIQRWATAVGQKTRGGAIGHGAGLGAWGGVLGHASCGNIEYTLNAFYWRIFRVFAQGRARYSKEREKGDWLATDWMRVILPFLCETLQQALDTFVLSVERQFHSASHTSGT